jgi:hypothetical protein
MSKYKAHIISMALIGLWHGANWTFVVFGLYWGMTIAIYLALMEHAANKRPAHGAQRPAAPARDVGSVVLMFALVSIGWVFFRAASIGDAWHVLTHALAFGSGSAVVAPEVGDPAILWALIGGLLLAEWLYRHVDRLRPWLEGGRVTAIAGRYALLAAMIVSAGVSQVGDARPFIYFQF